MTLTERLRAALRAQGGHETPLLPGDPVHRDETPASVPAAVLVAVVDRPEPGILLTLRTETLRKHAGQVAFPGGRIDPEDRGPIEAALREAEEEIGLPRALVQVVGTADPYRTVTGYEVIPVLGVVPPDLAFVPHEAEVAAVFEAPLAYVFDPPNQIERSMMRNGVELHYFEIMFGDFRIWGATAAMLVNLSRRLRAFL